MALPMLTDAELQMDPSSVTISMAGGTHAFADHGVEASLTEGVSPGNSIGQTTERELTR